MPPYRPPHLRNAPQRASDTPSSSSLPSLSAPPKQQAPLPPKQPISKLALEHLPSLSRSSTEADSALLQLDVQDAYRELVLEKLQRALDRAGLEASFRGEMKGRELVLTVGDLLLMLRKLREAIIATGRLDAFAVEVYELSTRLALQSGNLPQLTSALGRLVPDLYDTHALTCRPSKVDLKDRLESLSLSNPSPTPSSSNCSCPTLSRPLYTSLAALLTLTTTSTPPHRPPPTPTSLALLTTLSLHQTSHSPPPNLLASLHPLERVAIALGRPARQRTTWAVLRSAYMMLSDGEKDMRWFEVVMELRKGEGRVWLEGKGIERSKAGGGWMIKGAPA